jgi:hypothetical protein
VGTEGRDAFLLAPDVGTIIAAMSQSEQKVMRPQTKLPPETIAIRQMLATAAASFGGGFIAVCVGVLWLHYATAPERFWSWELIVHVLQSLHLALFGGLCLCALCCSAVSRRHFRLRYHRCPYCGRALRGIGKWCSCREVQVIQREADAAARRPVA